MEPEKIARHVTNDLGHDGLAAYEKLHGKARALVEGKF